MPAYRPEYGSGVSTSAPEGVDPLDWMKRLKDTGYNWPKGTPIEPYDATPWPISSTSGTTTTGGGEQDPPNEGPAQDRPTTSDAPTNAGWSYQGTGFQAPNRAALPLPPPPPVAAPDFAAIAGQLGTAQMGPQYQTAAGSWMGENLLPDLENFARNWMQNFNPYATQLASTTRAAGDARIKQAEQDATRGIEEWAASRGLTGSSVEGDQMVGLAERLQAQRLEEERALMEALANFDLLGRQSAGGFGLNVGGFGRALGDDRRSEGQFAHTAERQRTRDFEDDQRARVDANLRAAGMQDTSTLSRADLEQRAYQIQLEAQMRGQSLDLQEAMAQAEFEMARNQMEQGEQHFRANFDAEQWWRELQRDLAISGQLGF